jgi:hypothetical protein
MSILPHVYYTLRTAVHAFRMWSRCTRIWDSRVFGAQSRNERTQQHFPTFADVVHTLEEPQGKQEFLWRYASMGAQPTT